MAQALSYRVERYGADGVTIHRHSPEYFLAHADTLEAARDVVRIRLHISRLASRFWQPPEEMGGGEGYSEYPSGHPRADGCGGYQITREEA